MLMSLMIDKNVTVNAYGSDAAVIIKDTTMEKSIYVLSNEKENVKRDVLSAENGMYTYSLFDDEGNVLKEVSFGNYFVLICKHQRIICYGIQLS